MRVTFGDRRISDEDAPYVIAELGVNHNGSTRTARKMIAAAKHAGADAVKIQAFHAEEFCAPGITYTWEDAKRRRVTEKQLALFKRYELKPEQIASLSDWAFRRGIEFFGTPTDREMVDVLYGLAVPGFKIGSDDVVHLPLLRYIGTKGLPVILSTGMADAQEIRHAMIALAPAPVILLHCVSLYPAPEETWNLRRIGELRRKFGPFGSQAVGTQPEMLVGFSDHTYGIRAAVAAVHAGACVIEKHFTLDRNASGPDHWFSATPDELADLVIAVRRAHVQRGNGGLEPTDNERRMRSLARRVAVCAKQSLPPKTRLREEHIAWKRAALKPGDVPLHPKDLHEMMGRELRVRLLRNEPITRSAISWPKIDLADGGAVVRE